MWDEPLKSLLNQLWQSITRTNLVTISVATEINWANTERQIYQWVSLIQTHTHTHTHTHIQMQSNTHMTTHVHTHIQPCLSTYSHAHKHTVYFPILKLYLTVILSFIQARNSVQTFIEIYWSSHSVSEYLTHSHCNISSYSISSTIYHLHHQASLPISRTFYSGVVESVLTYYISTWCSSWSMSDKKVPCVPGLTSCLILDCFHLCSPPPCV